MILLFEDLSHTDYDKIIITYDEAKRMFGSDKIDESIVVIGNKINLNGYDRGKKKSDRISKTSELLGLRYSEFETSYDERVLSDDEIRNQMGGMMPVLNSAKPFDLRSTQAII
jgi:hypothetical protein